MAVGHSFGATLALAEAAAAGDPDTLMARLADVVDDDRRLGDTRSPDELRRMATLWSHQDPDVLESMTDERFDEWAEDPALDDLPRRVRCPVFCVNGDPNAGSIVSAAQGVRHLALYPGSDQVRLDGTDHRLGLDEAPVRVVDARRPFLAGLP